MFLKQWDRQICINCMTCVKVCPNDNLVEYDHQPTRAQLNTCTGCNYCTDKCPTKAIFHTFQNDENGYGHWNPTVINRIHKMAQTGKYLVEAKGTMKQFINFDDLVFLPAQIDKAPLLEEDNIDTTVIIGPKSKKPITIQTPIMVGAMSFGALSKEAKIALAKATKEVGSVANSGEGGMLPEERKHAKNYILQYSTGRFGISEETLKKADAIEIKIGQGAKPGMGGHLLGAKVTPEIAQVRNIEPRQNAISPSHHLDIDNPKELGERIEYLRELTGGVPIGIKIVGGNIEKDMAHIINGTLKPDFISIDGGEGGTGAAPVIAKDNVALPLIYTLSKVSEILSNNDLKNDITLIAAGGMRSSAEFIKAIALGADAVYSAGAMKIAMGCVYCRACHTGKCPTGICTQNKVLREQRFDVEKNTKQVINFFLSSLSEMKEIARMVGKNIISDLNKEDLFSLDPLAAKISGVRF